MATVTYTLETFVSDLDRITRDETSPDVIAGRATSVVLGARGDRRRAQPRDVGRHRRHRQRDRGDALPRRGRRRGRPDDAVEIHVYGRDLAGLKRKTWDAEGTETPLITPKYMNC